MATKVQKKTAVKNDSRIDEVIAIVLLAIAVLVFLCLISYNENDPSVITKSGQPTRNWIGVVGANIAAVLFSAIGTTAYILPALLALVAWRVFRTQSFWPRPIRVFGFLLFVVSASSLMTLFGGYGAIVGVFFAQIFTYLLGAIGAGVLLGALLLTSVLLVTSISYASFFGGVKYALEAFGLRFDNLSARFRAWRDEQNKAAQERLERRREMRLERESSPSISTGETHDSTANAAAAVASTAAKKEKAQKKVEEKETAMAASASASASASPLGIKIGDLFKRAAADDRPNDNEPQIEPETQARIAEVESQQEELPRPTISISEAKIASPESDTEELEPIADNLDEDVSPISISPMRATGDLEDSAFAAASATETGLEKETKSEETENEKPAIAENPPPQNFDNYVLPEPEFLTPAPPHLEQKEDELLAIARELTEKTKEFNVTGRVMHICQGPVVTTYEFKPDPGVKYSRITNLSDDLCLALKAENIRIDRIPGKAYVGIEVPNQNRETIFLREVVESKKFRDSNSLLTIALGKTIDGLNYVADLAKMPHLLIAGATGAGKSVGVNTLVVSILYKAKPDEVKFIMVDPKRLELGLYADIPHLATPIITDPKRAAISLKWAVGEMEKRYRDLAGWGVRNIDGFNAEVKKRNAAEHFDDNGEPWKMLPYIVIIIDELADLMMVAGKEVEESITRLAQMARAVGIHLVLATQRPSVDVITGLIKANFPARISFRVSSKVDSRTIIDSNGAERLLGRGDMLFLPPATSQIVRVHGAFVDEKEIQRIVEHIKSQGRPEYDTTITKTEEEMDDGDLPGKSDPLFADALRTVVGAKRASTSLLQRHLRIGYGRAAAILDAMVREGYIGEMDGSTRARPILQKAYEALQEAEEGREL
jgi:DNA segregation ATPase FtsK/SpoIIIE, S-DNA-T family